MEHVKYQTLIENEEKDVGAIIISKLITSNKLRNFELYRNNIFIKVFPKFKIFITIANDTSKFMLFYGESNGDAFSSIGASFKNFVLLALDSRKFEF